MADGQSISDIKRKFEDTVNATPGIATFVFDDLSSINLNRDKDYPVFLLKPPRKFKTNKPEDKGYSFYRMDQYIFTPGSRDDNFTYDQAWSEVEPLAHAVIDAIDRQPPGNYAITGNTEIEYGHHQHNDMLYAVRFQYVMKIYDGC